MQEPVETLMRQIREHLDVCDSERSPTICAMRGANKEQLIQQIFQLIANEAKTIAEAIDHLETIYNLNETE